MSTNLNVGDKAPDFSLKDKDGKVHALHDIKSDYVMVYFYPKDNTPGCTIESNKLNDSLDEFKKLGVTIIGISGGDEKSKTKFCERYGFKFTLLSDTEFRTSEKYGVYGEKSFMGRKYMGIFRETFVLDKGHKIIKIFEKVKPPVHAQELLDHIKSLNE